MPCSNIANCIGCNSTIEECTKCGGSGARSKDDVVTCSRCSGSGRVTEIQNTILGRVQTQTVCPDCRGAGKTIKHKCDACHGRGTVNKTKTIEVKVPAGIDDGQQIRLRYLPEAVVRIAHGQPYYRFAPCLKGQPK